MSENKKVKSPLGLRLCIWVGAALLSVLLIWLLGFILHDADRFKVIDYREIEKKHVPESLTSQLDGLKDDIRSVNEKIEAGEEHRRYPDGDYTVPGELPENRIAGKSMVLRSPELGAMCQRCTAGVLVCVVAAIRRHAGLVWRNNLWWFRWVPRAGR